MRTVRLMSASNRPVTSTHRVRHDESSSMEYTIAQVTPSSTPADVPSTRTLPLVWRKNATSKPSRLSTCCQAAHEGRSSNVIIRPETSDRQMA
jgi:hypothetical protein